MQQSSRSTNRRSKQHPIKYIFVTGGVVSSIGKGLTAAAIGALLEARGLRVAMTKMDPYINVDPGTMSPIQHGEVFVTDDGAETDLDLGHYQRFTHANLRKKNSFTTGQIYDAVINRERKGDYLGGTVQVIPHVTELIKENMSAASEGVDVSIIEVGGTIGDIESLPFLEAIRQYRDEIGRENTVFVHVTLVPYIKAAGELKTKPTQHSVKELSSIGIQPDILVCRTEYPMSEELKGKIARFCSVERDCVFEAMDVDTIYRMPVVLHQQGMDARVCEFLGIWSAQPQLQPWVRILERIEKPKQRLKIGVVGKYMGTRDSYKSLYEALTHGGIENEAAVEIVGIDSELLERGNPAQLLSGLDGVVVPGGFGDRGVEGKMLAIRYCRENALPFLGICLGMQLATIEFARNVLKLNGATSEEFDAQAEHKIIHLMEGQLKVERKGGSMRLGAYECVVKKGTQGAKAYDAPTISERHRHRFEFNPEYRAQFEKAGFVVSGESPDGTLVEMMEIPTHPWFLACQFHPELKSRPMQPHPLFSAFVKAAAEKNQKS
jgi:CTP synthase